MLEHRPDFIPSLKEVTQAYETWFNGDRVVLSCSLISATPKMRKWILEYHLIYCHSQNETGEDYLIGKMYSDPEKGLVSFKTMQYLWEHGMGFSPDYTIVRPIAFLPSFQMLIMSKAPGKTLDAYILYTNDGKQAVYNVAKWLNHLHAIPSQTLKMDHTYKTRVDLDVTRYVTELQIKVPQRSAAFIAYHKNFLRKASYIQKGPSVSLHGDFHTKNVYVNENHVTAIDFDHHFVGDPAWDVAYLACQIQLRGYFIRGDFHHFDSIVKYFITTYLDDYPSCDREAFMERLALYRARSLFESLHYEIVICNKKKLDIVNAFVRECELSLQGKGFYE
ncbi:MAG: phosphotransferase [Paenibacillaceae bacterium]